jgi:type I restriction enzyme S subunit
VRVVPKDGLLDSLFISYYLNWGFAQKRLKLLASRGVSQSNINATKLRGFHISLPPLPVQQEIAEILSALDVRIQAEESKKNSLEFLFKTLLELLMTGKIRIYSLEQPL